MTSSQGGTSRSGGARANLSTPTLWPRARRVLLAIALPVTLALLALAPVSASGFGLSFLERLHETMPIESTVPENGDLNPYGIAVVRQNAGQLIKGNVLISNFNNAGAEQGRGSTIVEISPQGGLSVFAQLTPKSLPAECPGGIGLSTALAILPDNYVVVGSLPSENGQVEKAGAGCLIVLNSNGKAVSVIAGEPINGPWDMTAAPDFGQTALFVTNVLNGTIKDGTTPNDEGDVVRVVLSTYGSKIPQVTSERVIATGFEQEANSTAFVLGPTGDALGLNGSLYVADTLDNSIAAVPQALRRTSVFEEGGTTVTTEGELNEPLGMTLAPNGDILTTNGGNGDIVETSPSGHQFEGFDTGAGPGGLFGLTITPNEKGIYIVNDAENSLELVH